MAKQGKQAKGLGRLADSAGCLLGGGASAACGANRVAAPIQIVLTRYGLGSPKTPKFDTLLLETMKAAKSLAEKAQLMLMAIAFVYLVVTEDLVNLEDNRPGILLNTIPADSRKSMKFLANHITDLAEELAVAKFKGLKEEHADMREAAIGMTGMHNKNNRLLASMQDVTTTECALAHLMNTNGAFDLDGSIIKLENGARVCLVCDWPSERLCERLCERLRANTVGQFWNSKRTPSTLDEATRLALARSNSTEG